MCERWQLPIVSGEIVPDSANKKVTLSISDNRYEGSIRWNYGDPSTFSGSFSGTITIARLVASIVIRSDPKGGQDDDRCTLALNNCSVQALAAAV